MKQSSRKDIQGLTTAAIVAEKDIWLKNVSLVSPSRIFKKILAGYPGKHVSKIYQRLRSLLCS